MSNMTTLALSFAVQDPSSGQTIQHFLEAGGELMIPIGICSVLVVALTLERVLALRRSRICPARVRTAVEDLGRGEHEAVAERLHGDATPAARVLLAGMRRRGFALRDVEGAMEDQAQKELEKLRRNVRPLVLIGGVAPLLGLLGTVLGIAESFRRVSQAGMGKPEVLASGIEMALNTTIAGLFVAIPAMIAASLLQGRVRGLVLRMDEMLSPAVEHLARRPGTPEEIHAA